MFEESNKLYELMDEKFRKDIVLHNINGLDIPFSPSWRNIGINLSGGADSASLALLLGRIITDNNYDCKVHVINFIRCWNTRPWQGPIGLDVYHKLQEMFPGVFVNRYENYIPPELEWGATNGPILNGRSGDQIEGSSYNTYISYRENFDATFNATSQNPLSQDFGNRLSKRDKLAKDGEMEDVIYRSNAIYFIHPYRFVQKDWIVSQFYLLDALDLYNTTRSCEGDIKLNPEIAKIVPTPSNYVHGETVIPECGECFWCLERNWAQSKVEDTIKEITEGTYGTNV